MDFTWETQSPKPIGVTAQLNHCNGRYGDETPSQCKVEFNPSEILHRLNTPHGSPSYRMEIHDERGLFQSDCQNRMPSQALQHPIGCKSSIPFYDTVTYRRVSATHNEIPLICAGDTPELSTLYQRKAQTRISPHGVGIHLDSSMVSPSYQTENPAELYFDTFPRVTCFNPRGLQKKMQPYALGIQSSSNKAQQSHQGCSSNEIPSHQTGNANEMRPDIIPRVTSLDPREAHSRMPPCGVDIRSDSNNINQHYQESSTNGFSFYQTDIPRELYPDNIPGETPLNSKEVQRRTPPNLLGVHSDSDNAPQSQHARSTNRILSYQMDNSREIHEIPAESETLSYQTDRLQKGIPLCEADFPEGVLSQRDDARTHEGVKTSSPKINANRSTSAAVNQPVPLRQTSHNLSSAQTCPRCHCVVTTQPQPSYLPSLNLLNEGVKTSSPKINANSSSSAAVNQPVPLRQTSHNLSRAQTCPRCHCVVTTQPQPSYLPSLNLVNANARPSVIMVPLKRKEESDLSGEDDDDDAEMKRCFRVDIDGTRATFKLTKEDWARIPVKSFRSGGRSLSGHWSRIFADKIKESNPWCNVRFKNNYVRSVNSRKVHSSVFFRGGAECKRPECSVKMKFVIREEYGKQVEVTYNGNVCHRAGE